MKKNKKNHQEKQIKRTIQEVRIALMDAAREHDRNSVKLLSRQLRSLQAPKKGR